LLLPDGGGTISGEGLGEIASVVVAENVFNSVEGNDYPAGSELVITFSGMPQPTLLQSVSDFFQGRTYVIVIIWIVGIALLGILGYAMYSSRKGGRSRDDTAEVFASRGDVVAEIAALDEAFESDEIDEGAYRGRRDDLKQLALDFEHTAASDSAETTEVPEDSEK
jgi:uncharacterized membrane protein